MSRVCYIVPTEDRAVHQGDASEADRRAAATTERATKTTLCTDIIGPAHGILQLYEWHR